MAEVTTGSLSAAIERAGQLLKTHPVLAERQAEAILQAAPGDGRAVLILGMARRRRGALAAARVVLAPLAAAQPNSATTHHELGLVLSSLGESAAAIEALERAAALKPDLPGPRFDLANLLYRQQRAADAMPHLERLLAAAPGDRTFRTLMAFCLERIGDYDRAIDNFEAVLVDHPGQPEIWLGLGNTLKTVGRTAEAAVAYRRAIALEPHLGEAYWGLVSLQKDLVSAADEAAILAQLARADVPAEDRWGLHYALGLSLEIRGDHAAAFDHYGRGAGLRRGVHPHDADDNTAFSRRSRALLTRDFFSVRAGVGSPSTAPIFIVGLPRSGSTLVEQILASHSAVEGTQELPEIVAISRALARPAPGKQDVQYPEVLADMAAAELAALGGAYIRRTRVYRKTGRPVFIDKMPNNFHHIGLIQLILPGSKIIDVRRHPMASGFSAFRQPFFLGQNFTYDLTDLGRYYRDYVELMTHVDRVLPGRVCRVIYEDLVEDTEAQVRRILDHCGLAFEPACLRFHDNPRAVRTASAEQVRRPLFRDGLDHWRHYEAWLGPLETALGPALETWRD